MHFHFEPPALKCTLSKGADRSRLSLSLCQVSIKGNFSQPSIREALFRCDGLAPAAAKVSQCRGTVGYCRYIYSSLPRIAAYHSSSFLVSLLKTI